MAKISQGDSLMTPLLQPGYTIENNGYGLLTCKATYKCDETTADSAIVRGDSFGPDSRLKCHKVVVAYNALGVCNISADYIGLADAESEWSQPEIGAAASLTAETITTHPRFMTTDGLSIAGVGTGTNTAPVYAPAFSIKTLKPYDAGIWEGNNGAIFELKNGGKFLGFYSRANDTAKKMFGRTSYLAPTSTFRGVIYTNNSAKVPTFLSYVGKTMYKRGPDNFANLLPSYYGNTFRATDETNQLLITSLGVEDYGTLYKFTYELRFNREGYPFEVYSGLNV